MDSPDLLQQYAPHTDALICAIETLAYKWSFKDYLQTGVAGVAMLNLSGCGSLTEARKIAAPHDCTGPVVRTASTHLSSDAPNVLIQESVRALYTGWYKERGAESATVVNDVISLNDSRNWASNYCPIFISGRTPWCGFQRHSFLVSRTVRSAIALPRTPY